MKLIALCGAAGAGKDTVADLLPMRKLAFADALYWEVSQAWGLSIEELKERAYKEHPRSSLAFMNIEEGNDEFLLFMWKKGHHHIDGIESPRQILQWWGDYRRAQDPDYFVKAAGCYIRMAKAAKVENIVITDVRFPNEAAMVRQLGGEIWQIKRPGIKAGGTGHASDTDGSEFNPDRIIMNSGTIEDLRKEVMK